MSTLRHKIANVVSVPLTLISLSLKKIIYPNNIQFEGIQRFSPGTVIDTDRKSKLVFGKCVSIHSRCRIVASCGGNISIGNKTSLNVGCILVSRKKIQIGSNVSFGPNVMVYDHDHTIDANRGMHKYEYNLAEVSIGDNTWIGAGSIILLGSKIGKNCTIAAGSVIKGNVPDNTVLIQKRITTYKGIGE